MEITLPLGGDGGGSAWCRTPLMHVLRTGAGGRLVCDSKIERGRRALERLRHRSLRRLHRDAAVSQAPCTALGRQSGHHHQLRLGRERPGSLLATESQAGSVSGVTVRRWAPRAGGHHRSVPVPNKPRVAISVAVALSANRTVRVHGSWPSARGARPSPARRCRVEFVQSSSSSLAPSRASTGSDPADVPGSRPIHFPARGGQRVRGRSHCRWARLPCPRSFPIRQSPTAWDRR
jgi:hypothetical protein